MRLSGMVRWQGAHGIAGCALLLGVLALPCQAADVGGWYADQQKAAAMAATKAQDDGCPQLIACAASDDSALTAYRAALCYLHSHMLTRHGIVNQENMHLDELAADKVYRFMYVYSPVPIAGATGSIGAPLAIR